MKRKLVVLAAALVAASFMGCQLMDTLFFNTEEVKASDLATFTGTTPTTKDEALKSVVFGVGGSVARTRSLMSSSEPVPAVLGQLFPAIKGSEAVFGGARAIARTITPSTGFKTFTDSVEANGEGKATVKFTNEDFDEVTGSTTLVLVNGEVTLEAKGLKEGSTAASGKANAELTAEVDAIADTPFNGAIANLKLNANADATMTSTGAPKTISGYAAFALSTGFSLDEVAGVSKGGKYVIAIKYTSNFEYDAAAAASDDPTGGLTVEIVLKVYNATNKKVGDYTYTEDEIADFIKTMMAS